MADQQNELALGAVITQVERVTSFTPPWAPGMALTAGMLGTETCASCHRDPVASHAGMAGEASEIIAQSRPLPEVIRANGEPCLQSLTHLAIGPDLVWGRNLFDEANVAVPAALCFRQSSGHGAGVISSGCAAGPDAQSAVRAGIYEVLEHAVMAAWWRGTDLPSGEVSYVRCRLTEMLEPEIKTARAETNLRTTEIGLIASICGVYAVAAWSFDRNGEGGFVVASAAHADLMEAARSAFRELCQLEWGLHLARIKQLQAGLAPSDFDDEVLVRSDCISRDDRRLVMNGLLPALEPQDLLERLKGSFSSCIDVTLHMQPGLHVHKVIIPELYCARQPFS